MADESKDAEPVDIHVGQAIRRRRRILGLSQDDLAAALGVTPQQIQKYEKALSRISASKLFMVARALKVPVAYFFADIDETESELFSGEVEDNISRFLRSKEGQELAAVFPQIEDKSVRQEFVALARAMAKAGRSGKTALS